MNNYIENNIKHIKQIKIKNGRPNIIKTYYIKIKLYSVDRTTVDRSKCRTVLYGAVQCCTTLDPRPSKTA